MIDLAKLRSLAEKATPGPWTSLIHTNDSNDECNWGPSYISQTPNKERGPENISEPMNENDAEFIAAANPQTIIELCDEIEAARAFAVKAGMWVHKRDFEQLRKDALYIAEYFASTENYNGPRGAECRAFLAKYKERE